METCSGEAMKHGFHYVVRMESILHFLSSRRCCSMMFVNIVGSEREEESWRMDTETRTTVHPDTVSTVDTAWIGWFPLAGESLRGAWPTTKKEGGLVTY